MISKCSNLKYGITLGYPRSDMVLGRNVNVRVRLTAIRRVFELYECLLVTAICLHTNIYLPSVILALLSLPFSSFPSNSPLGAHL